MLTHLRNPKTGVRNTELTNRSWLNVEGDTESLAVCAPCKHSCRVKRSNTMHVRTPTGNVIFTFLS